MPGGRGGAPRPPSIEVALGDWRARQGPEDPPDPLGPSSPGTGRAATAEGPLSPEAGFRPAGPSASVSGAPAGLGSHLRLGSRNEHAQ